MSALSGFAQSVAWLDWQWTWEAFWPELIAGLITFGIGIPLAFLLIRHQLGLARTREFEQFQTLAKEVRDDFVQVERTLGFWSHQVRRDEIIEPIDPPTLTWEIDESQLRFVFASNGVHHVTERAVKWFQNAVDVARKWNEERAIGPVSDGTARRASFRIEGTLVQLRAAIRDLESAAKLEKKESA